MFGNGFDSALAMLCFLQAYLADLRKEVSMKAKNERERQLEQARESESPRDPRDPRDLREPRNPDLHRRRFWHRRAAAASAPATPRSDGARCDGCENEIE